MAARKSPIWRYFTIDSVKENLFVKYVIRKYLEGEWIDGKVLRTIYYSKFYDNNYFSIEISQILTLRSISKSTKKSIKSF